jgi:hypothetical protein
MVQGLTVHAPKRGGTPASDYSFVFEQILRDASQEATFEVCFETFPRTAHTRPSVMV